MLSPNSKKSDKNSKAQKILGTTDIPIQHNRNNSREDKKRGRRPSFMRAPEIKSNKGGSFVPFPTATPDAGLSSPHLRVRASSPLLGHEYHSHDNSPPPLPKSSKNIHHSGSSSTLYSYFSRRDSTNDSNTNGNGSTKDLGRASSSHSQQSNTDPRISMKPSKGGMKESKRKMRPPRIDLSLLFPKPKPAAAPLLSPQRMMSSPSPVSVVSELPTAVKKPDDTQAGIKTTATNTLSDTLVPPPSHAKQHKNRASSVFSEVKFRDWLDPSLERSVRTSEMDLALDKYADTQQTPKPSNASIRSRDQLHSSHSNKSADRTAGRMSSNRSEGGWSKETYLSPKTRPRQMSNRSSNAPDWQSDRCENRPSEKGSMSKKSSKSTLRNTDLNISSVLCLSSSESEDDDDYLTKERVAADHSSRDSVTTYGEFEPEICTASAAQATRGPPLKRVDAALAAVDQRSRSTKRNTVRRMPSKASTEKSSYTGPRSRSRRSSGIPTISEPEAPQQDDWFFPPPPSPSTREINRRSRIITVTRQEEHLLEAMRLRKGKITPSLYQEARYNGNSRGVDPEQASMLSAPSRDSFYGGDTSFLRLSPGFPPYLQRADQGANLDNSASQGAASDADQKTINSNASNRVSLAYSESLPSPATSGASPLTPTLPIHRFSPLPSQKPPPRHPPPAVPHEQRRHSRRRTDSSEAIVLGEAEDTKEKEEFPIWAFGNWNDRTNLTAVH
ncbi:hypothetical protein ASPWEDRAFT_99545 [Aspergillus wentii DTO 134E9]|uniref:Uncharacterized protein n=1 Tax=Aspergillus wentii DTO 134E9 TaxID=1073089 RepID=A0A1L9RZ81_ASPWE|nr:uncharacterized protein ASPWEDRAFT_99545 [Aspergillus wentii DTO 134E9]OJJ40270.1 hypothetical protein ASPWEDRAFT_99545 [Aspergillus wentii DTO 134E9]